jgi:type IV fimbrial biogenesis protein FimT
MTIVEMIIVLALLAILSAVSAPGLGTFIQNSRLRGEAYDLMSTVLLARSEAGKRGVRVILCRSANPTASSPSCGGTAHDWTTGWLLFASGDTNNTYEALTDTLLKVGASAPVGLTVHTNDTSNRNLEYNADGSTNEDGGTARFAICDQRGGASGRQVNVPPHGRPNLRQGSTASQVQCSSPT